jgi:hypothetical protein
MPLPLATFARLPKNRRAERMRAGAGFPLPHITRRLLFGMCLRYAEARRWNEGREALDGQGTHERAMLRHRDRASRVGGMRGWV